jgi:hypothetical protein
LETPRPEELLVAAARLIIIRTDHQTRVVVDIFGTVESDAIRKILLLRLESVCRSQGWNHVTIEIPSWSESIQNWFSSQGYEDLGIDRSQSPLTVLGGRAWPDEQQEILLKPTMILEYQVSVSLSLLRHHRLVNQLLIETSRR